MWSPNEVRKLISQIIGFFSMIGGFYLIIKNVQATGKINISTDLIKGEIESGSAGFLLIFIAFFLIVIPFVSLKLSKKHDEKTIANIDNTEEKGQKIWTWKDTSSSLAGLILGSGLTVGLSYWGDYLSEVKKLGIGNLLIFGSYVIGIGTGILLIFLLLVIITRGAILESSTEDNDQSKK